MTQKSREVGEKLIEIAKVTGSAKAPLFDALNMTLVDIGGGKAKPVQIELMALNSGELIINEVAPTSLDLLETTRWILTQEDIIQLKKQF